jgi:hypothetical protein
MDHLGITCVLVFGGAKVNHHIMNNFACTLAMHVVKKANKEAGRHDKDFMKWCYHHACQHLEVAKTNLEAAFCGAEGDSVVKSGAYLSQVLMTLVCRESQGLRKKFTVDGRQAWFPTAVVCVGASTTIAHTEMDHTYTLIHCPSQEGLGYNSDSRATFNFYLQGVADDMACIKIPLNEGTSVFFSGTFLMHRQECNESQFVNLGFYGNQKVNQFGYRTLQRLIKKPKKWKNRRKQLGTK